MAPVQLGPPKKVTVADIAVEAEAKRTAEMMAVLKCISKWSSSSCIIKATFSSKLYNAVINKRLGRNGLGSNLIRGRRRN